MHGWADQSFVPGVIGHSRLDSSETVQQVGPRGLCTSGLPSDEPLVYCGPAHATFVLLVGACAV